MPGNHGQTSPKSRGTMSSSPPGAHTHVHARLWPWCIARLQVTKITADFHRPSVGAQTLGSTQGWIKEDQPPVRTALITDACEKFQSPRRGEGRHPGLVEWRVPSQQGRELATSLQGARVQGQSSCCVPACGYRASDMEALPPRKLQVPWR